MKYKPSRDLPRFIRELKTFSPSILREYILTKRNKAVTPESISNWLRRNPKIRVELGKEIISSEITNEEVKETIFHNGTFEALPVVARWITDQKRRKLANWKANIGQLKNICRGYSSQFKIPNWTPKHPSRLTQEDVLLLIDYLHEQNRESAGVRLVARNFFKSCNKPYSRISGAKGSGFGKQRDLFVPKEILDKIFNYIKKIDYESFVADFFMFKTATRITATLKAKIEDMKMVEGYYQLTVYDKARRSMYANGKPTPKFISNELYEELKKIIGDRHEGTIFQNLEKQKLSNLNRIAFKIFIPKIEKTLTNPNHFWRHMFAQHMLRLTGWKYGIVASLGGWTVQALQESYGKPPIATIREWGKEWIHKI
ncbi:hypothetical protein ES702_03913 [subsurface metagenome]